MKIPKCLRLLILVLVLILAVVLVGLASGADQVLSPRDYSGISLGGAAEYGRSMAASGDWLAVGAPGMSTDHQGRYRGGRVLLWKRVAGKWTLRQVLTWPDDQTGSDHQFGIRLAMDGDRLLVGNKSGARRVHSFKLEGDTWVLDGMLTSQGGANDFYLLDGALQLSGDLAVVGSPSGRVNGQQGVGWVEVFQRQSAGWVLLARLTDSETDTAKLGQALAIRGDTLYAGAAQKVVIFERNGATWTKARDLLPPRPHGFGEWLQVSGDRLFVVGWPGFGAQVFEYDIPGGHALLNEVPLLQDGVPCVQGDTMIQVTASGMEIRRRQVDQTWAKETTPYVWNDGLRQVYSGLLVEGDILLGGARSALPYATERLFLDTVMVCQRQADRWTWSDGRLAPMSADQIRDADFGRSVAASDTWMVVGAPSKADDGNSQAGLAFVYRRRPDGGWRYHSLLPDPVFPGSSGMNLVHYGRQVALAGGWAAVTINNSMFSSFVPQIILYAYDAGADAWRQAPGPGLIGESMSGEVMVMREGLLATSSLGGPVLLFRLTDVGWGLEAALTRPASAHMVETFGASLALEGERLLVGSPGRDRGSVYVFDKKGAQWTQTARLLPPVASKGAGRFGQTVALSGSQALVGYGDSDRGLVTPFSFSSGSWKAQASLTSGLTESYPKSSAMSGSVAVVNDGHSLSAYGLLQNRWTGIPTGLSPDALGAPGGGWRSIAAGGLAMSSSQVMAGVNGKEVRVLDLVRLPEITFGFQASVSSTEGSVQTLDAGEYAVGADFRQFGTITAVHEGAGPVRLSLQISEGSGEFTLGKSLVSLEPNQKEVLDIRFQPASTGLKSVTLTVTSDVPGASSRIYVLQARVVATASALRFTQALLPGIYEASEVPRLEFALSGTLPWSFRWLKNGRAMPGETAPVLQPTEGGSYQVEVSNPHGKILSDPVPIGLFKVETPSVLTLKGSKARCAISVSGPVEVRWWGFGQPLEDGPEYSGTKTPVLTLKSARPMEDFYAELVLPGHAESGLILEMDLRVVSAPVIFSSLDSGGIIPLGVEQDLSFGLQYEGPYFSSPVFRFGGVPPGMKGDPGGGIYGVPTTPGVYTLQVTATVDGFTTAKSFRLAVSKTGMIPGLYWGWLETSADLPEAGVVVLDVQPSGAYSGRLQLGSTRTPLAGTVMETYGSPVVLRPFPVKLQGQSKVFGIENNGTERHLILQVREASAPDATGDFMSELVLIKSHGSQPVPGKAGGYNFGLLCRDFGGFNELDGNGFGTLKVSADRRVTYTGQLADGSSLTGSSWLSDVAEDGLERVYFYQTDPRTRTLLRGAAALELGESEYERLLTWQRPPSRGRVYAEGIPAREITFAACRYAVPKNATLLPGEAQQVEFFALNTYLNPVPFRLTKQHTAIFGKGAANPLQTRLAIYAPTGFFTGQFTQRDPDPANEARTLVRTVQYRGMLLPELEVGVGHFLLPSLPDPTATPPTTLATSPIHSGSVIILPAAEPNE